MVAIALYKGYLRRLPDVPRKWIMPTRQISFKDFKNLRRRRSKALSRLTTTIATTSNNSNPNHEPEPKISVLFEDGEDQIGGAKEGGKCLENGEDVTAHSVVVKENLVVDIQIGDVEAEKNSVVANTVAKVVEDEKEMDKEGIVAKVVEDGKEMDKEGIVEAVNTPTEISKNEGRIIDEGKRKKELEEKLHLLKEKKHGLVQALKQILNAEEELKRRNCPQGAAGRTSGPPHLDIPKDIVSINKLNTPRLSPDGILPGEVEVAEPEGISNQNADARHSVRTSIVSPSDSQTKKIPHLARTTSGSPSRFGPAGQFGHPCVSVSGTNYVASSPSPSPAASGGTSVFRDYNWS